MASETETASPMHTEPQKQHDWLQRLVGDWTTEAEWIEPGKPPQKATGTETVRSLGGLWTVAEGEGDAPDGGTTSMIMTLGYDPRTDRFVGTFIASSMAHMWVYDGTLDEAKGVLTLEAEGPSMAGDGSLAKYRDAIEIRSNDHRVMTSHVQGDDGAWHQMMSAEYRRRT